MYMLHQYRIAHVLLVDKRQTTFTSVQFSEPNLAKLLERGHGRATNLPGEMLWFRRSLV